MKTYAIFPVRNTTFCVDGVSKEFTPEDQIGVVSVDGVSLMDLLGALQFHHCKAIELDEAEMLQVVEEDEDEGYSEGEPIQVMVTEVAAVDQPGVDESDESETIDLDDEESTTLDDTAEFAKPDKSAHDQFIADGLDEKIAVVLTAQGCTPESIRGLISEGFDLTELEEIGKSRAAAILAVYGPKPTE